MQDITCPLLDPLQFTCRSNSLVDDVNIVLHYILQHHDCPGTNARILFIDFTSALNTIIPEVLHSNLASICQWITNLLTDYTEYNNWSFQHQSFHVCVCVQVTVWLIAYELHLHSVCSVYMHLKVDLCALALPFVFIWYKEQMNVGTSHKNTCPSMAAVEHLSCADLLFNYSLYSNKQKTKKTSPAQNRCGSRDLWRYSVVSGSKTTETDDPVLNHICPL